MQSCVPARHGISLLEVLVAMGLLSIGLLSTLALFPAGGTYLRSADIDDRAAALIPAAYHTMQAQGLFRSDALFWQDQPERTDSDLESSVVGYPNVSSSMEAEAADAATIEEWFPAFDDPPTISGVAAPGAVVTITASASGVPQKTFTVPADATTGIFALTLSIDELTASNVGRMTIHESSHTGTLGAPKDYYDDWTFSAKYGEPPNQTTVAGLVISGPVTPPRMGNEPSAPTFRQYRKRRKVGTFRGPAKIDYTLPGVSSTSTAVSDASLLGNFPPRGQVYTGGRVLFAQASRLRVYGELWRYQAGRKRGRYSEWIDFSNTNPTQSQTYQNPRYQNGSSGPWQDESWNPKNPDGPDSIKEDVADWFKFPVRKGELVTVKPSAPTASLVDLSFDVDVTQSRRLLPLYLNGDTDAHVLEPFGAGVGSLTYLMPQDGTAYTRMNLVKVGITESGIDQNNNVIEPYKSDSDSNYRINTTRDYQFDISIVGNTRVAVIDPLIASHIDRIVNNNEQHPLAGKQKYFAAFQQSGRTELTTIPRMTWKYIANQPSFAISVALAERLCRPYDSLDVLVPTDEVRAPEPIFEASGGAPLMRRSVGRMSWLVTIQPENGGSIELNWQAGNFFDVAIVVFEDRLIPPLGATILEGEQVLGDQAGETVAWNPLTGLIDIPIGTSRGIDLDDLRRMFKPGAWLMLVPKAFSHDQTIDWVEIQTCEFERQSNGFTVARVLPTREPKVQGGAGGNELIAVVPQGVVAVARRSVRIE